MGIQEQDKGNYLRAAQPLDEELQRELDEALGDVSLGDILAAEEAAERAKRAERAEEKRAAQKAQEAQGARQQDATGDERPARQPSRGVRIGKVTAVVGEDVFVDFGSKSQGVLPVRQFEDEPLPKPGDAVEVTIEGYDPSEGLLLLSRKGAVLAATWDSIERGQVVEARITGHNKGGLEVSINGVPAFMPVSMIEMTRVEDLAQYVNRKLTCEIMEIDYSRQSVIVSRRSVLQRELEQARQQTLASLEEGKTVTGVVRSLMPYGAFVDLGGVDGLVHISDISHRRLDDPAQVLTEGQQVQVKVLKIDREENRISLGIKQAMPDPWEGAAARYPADSLTTGRISRLADFGAFVELEEGVEGLIPLGEMTFERRIRKADEVVNAGDVVRVRVLAVEPDRRRISLSLKRAGDDPWIGASVRWPAESIVEGVVRRLETFGAFVELTPGVDGLVHISELAEGRVRAVSDVVKEGQTVQAKVLSVDEERRRISLSIRQLVTMPQYTGPAGLDYAAAGPAGDQPGQGAGAAGAGDIGGPGAGAAEASAGTPGAAAAASAKSEKGGKGAKVGRAAMSRFPAADLHAKRKRPLKGGLD